MRNWSLSFRDQANGSNVLNRNRIHDEYTPRLNPDRAAGLGALALAEESVNTMKVELIALQPGLVKAQEETAELTAQVTSIQLPE